MAETSLRDTSVGGITYEIHEETGLEGKEIGGD